MNWYENSEAIRYVAIFTDNEEMERTIQAAREHGWVVADTIPEPCADEATRIIVFHEGDRFDGVSQPRGCIVTFVRAAPAHASRSR